MYLGVCMWLFMFYTCKMFVGVYVCTYVYPHTFMFSGLCLILYFCVCMYVCWYSSSTPRLIPRAADIRRGRLRPRSSRPHAMYARRWCACGKPLYICRRLKLYGDSRPYAMYNRRSPASEKPLFVYNSEPTRKNKSAHKKNRNVVESFLPKRPRQPF